MPKLFFKIRLCRVMLELSPAAFDIYSEMQEVDMVKVNTAAKSHPGEIGSIFHWAAKHTF
jgi:hypothetical protein